MGPTLVELLEWKSNLSCHGLPDAAQVGWGQGHPEQAQDLVGGDGGYFGEEVAHGQSSADEWGGSGVVLIISSRGGI